ncbi:hypothetical protein [Bradyrhizobium sp. SZCCHNRI2010]|uniref:hypothetical protein n=1 Tax=Bradyrhizobium sp. SZCCHNRI2010 TaxID=3057283 RepID=UPI0028EC3EB3|nr:hypothetical protein [Bradyrhizobium sp. SZCCHNRI2010]
MKTYDVIKDIWRNGVLVRAGSVITAVESEVKYLKHAVQEKVAKVEVVAAKVEAAAAKVVTDVKAAETKVLGAITSEAPANGNASK